LGIVHRDIKPSNLFCVRGADGHWVIKVLDFGISKMTSFNASGAGIATRTSAIMGSPLYMSPEQMRSARAVHLVVSEAGATVALDGETIGTTPLAVFAAPVTATAAGPDCTPCSKC
jgi:serine/threonine protein kinase